ncbi:MAG: hypothetical protein ABH952_03000 [Candidatus Omnitrophota bacterium]
MNAFLCMDISLAAGGNLKGLHTHLAPPLALDGQDVALVIEAMPVILQQYINPKIVRCHKTDKGVVIGVEAEEAIGLARKEYRVNKELPDFHVYYKNNQFVINRVFFINGEIFRIIYHDKFQHVYRVEDEDHKEYCLRLGNENYNLAQRIAERQKHSEILKEHVPELFIDKDEFSGRYYVCASPVGEEELDSAMYKVTSEEVYKEVGRQILKIMDELAKPDDSGEGIYFWDIPAWNFRVRFKNGKPHVYFVDIGAEGIRGLADAQEKLCEILNEFYWLIEGKDNEEVLSSKKHREYFEDCWVLGRINDIGDLLSLEELREYFSEEEIIDQNSATGHKGQKANLTLPLWTYVFAGGIWLGSFICEILKVLLPYKPAVLVATSSLAAHHYISYIQQPAQILRMPWKVAFDRARQGTDTREFSTFIAPWLELIFLPGIAMGLSSFIPVIPIIVGISALLVTLTHGIPTETDLTWYEQTWRQFLHRSVAAALITGLVFASAHRFPEISIFIWGGGLHALYNGIIAPLFNLTPLTNNGDSSTDFPAWFTRLKSRLAELRLPQWVVVSIFISLEDSPAPTETTERFYQLVSSIDDSHIETMLYGMARAILIEDLEITAPWTPVILESLKSDFEDGVYEGGNVVRQLARRGIKEGLDILQEIALGDSREKHTAINTIVDIAVSPDVIFEEQGDAPYVRGDFPRVTAQAKDLAVATLPSVISVLELNMNEIVREGDNVRIDDAVSKHNTAIYNVVRKLIEDGFVSDNSYIKDKISLLLPFVLNILKPALENDKREAYQEIRKLAEKGNEPALNLLKEIAEGRSSGKYGAVELLMDISESSGSSEETKVFCRSLLRELMPAGLEAWFLDHRDDEGAIDIVVRLARREESEAITLLKKIIDNQNLSKRGNILVLNRLVEICRELKSKELLGFVLERFAKYLQIDKNIIEGDSYEQVVRTIFDNEDLPGELRIYVYGLLPDEDMEDRVLDLAINLLNAKRTMQASDLLPDDNIWLNETVKAYYIATWIIIFKGLELEIEISREQMHDIVNKIMNKTALLDVLFSFFGGTANADFDIGRRDIIREYSWGGDLFGVFAHELGHNIEDLFCDTFSFEQALEIAEFIADLSTYVFFATIGREEEKQKWRRKFVHHYNAVFEDDEAEKGKSRRGRHEAARAAIENIHRFFDNMAIQDRGEQIPAFREMLVFSLTYLQNRTERERDFEALLEAMEDRYSGYSREKDLAAGDEQEPLEGEVIIRRWTLPVKIISSSHVLTVEQRQRVLAIDQAI